MVIESLSHERTKALYSEVQESLFGNYAALKSDLKNVIVWVFFKSTSVPNFSACMHTSQKNHVSQTIIRKNPPENITDLSLWK